MIEINIAMLIVLCLGCVLLGFSICYFMWAKTEVNGREAKENE